MALERARKRGFPCTELRLVIGQLDQRTRETVDLRVLCFLGVGCGECQVY